MQDVADCGSHWACTYPGHRAPRRLNDGDTMFIARLVEDPDDILIYGRAVACQHDPAKDVATEADIVRHPWKANWPNYIRVHDAEFLAGTLSNGISLRKLAEELGDSCFASTEERAAKGEAGINPLTTLGQKPDVRLSERGKLWIHEQLEAAFTRHGRIPEADMAALDWPISPLRPNREIAHQLSPAALKLLQLLIEIVRDKDFVPGRSQIGYEETLHALGIPVAEGRAGQQLKQHGLVELAECLNDLKLPAITGIIVNISGQRRNLPGGEYYEAFGKNDGDEIWRLSEIRKSMGWDWNSISRK